MLRFLIVLRLWPTGLSSYEFLICGPILTALPVKQVNYPLNSVRFQAASRIIEASVRRYVGRIAPLASSAMSAALLCEINLQSVSGGYVEERVQRGALYTLVPHSGIQETHLH